MATTDATPFRSRLAANDRGQVVRQHVRVPALFEPRRIRGVLEAQCAEAVLAAVDPVPVEVD
ncbi:MAG: hypothetical protein AAB225_10885, partial [Acidobacteriota bacterium]